MSRFILCNETSTWNKYTQAYIIIIIIKIFQRCDATLGIISLRKVTILQKKTNNFI
jgi:hypothetical protein